MRRLSMPLLLIVLLSVPLAVCAQVYKWKDAHGTTHFSDTPPPHGVHYTNLKSVAQMSATPTNGASGNAENPSREADTSDSGNAAQGASGRMSDTPTNRKKLCDNLKANIKLLNGDQPVITKNASGKSEVMTKNGRSSELAREQKQYQQYCQD